MFDQFVQDQPGLELICQYLRQKPWIALDTEFVRERTYYARLCLIQIATSDQLFCVDPLAADDL
ncbi:MAG: ribonuclease D, partial [Acidiferrobacterales bacterium]